MGTPRLEEGQEKNKGSVEGQDNIERTSEGPRKCERKNKAGGTSSDRSMINYSLITEKKKEFRNEFLLVTWEWETNK